MESREIREKFLKFFEERGHKIVPSSSLISDDPSVLVTTAGMQQFKKYYTGEADPMRDFGMRNTASIQKSFRTSDIDEVGDESHLTFFQMLGHFSFGDYFKKETIEWTYELLTRVFGIEPGRINASVFAGDERIPFDKESYGAWSKFLPEERIKKGGREDNIWGPAGPEGPCGAANEVYVDGLEVATLVFMEYQCAKDGILTPLPQKGVDVGWGLERFAKASQGAATIFETDLFTPLLELLPDSLDIKKKRIIVDHLRASAFLIADGVRPSNKDRGYILRRLLRRAMAVQRGPTSTDQRSDLDRRLLEVIIAEYGDFYPELRREKENVFFVAAEEYAKFGAALRRGLKELERLESVDAKTAFRLYESYGLPYEVIKDYDDGRKAGDLTREAFEEELKKHQELSRAGAESKFGGHGLYLKTGEVTVRDQSELEKVTRLHTATHLLHAGLRAVLGPEVRQDGSDITVERTRFDFLFPRRMTPEEIKKTEDWVNDKIQRDLSVKWEEMSYDEAIKSGALSFFKEKYPPRVKVYTIYDSKTGEEFSKEFCGGPHVERTGTIGKFKIMKEESSSAGVRRIRAVVE